MDWVEWKNTLIAVDYPNASLLDEKSVVKTLFQPTREHRKLLCWTCSQIIQSGQLTECRSVDTNDLLAVFSTFVFVEQHILQCFIDGNLLKDTQASIWNCILKKLKIKGRCGGTLELRRKLLSDLSQVTPDVLKSLGVLPEVAAIDGPSDPSDDLKEVDALLERADTILNQDVKIEDPPTLHIQDRVLSPVKVIGNLKSFHEKHSTVQSTCLADKAKDIEPMIESITEGVNNLIQCVEGLKTLKDSVILEGLPK